MPHSRSVSGARRWTLGVFLTLLLALCAALLPAHPAHAAGGATLHALVNEARFANGQPGLLRNAALDGVAAAWADQLAAAGELSHNPDYAAQLPGGWVSAAENVAQGYSGEAAMHDGWMASAGHRANILGDFTDIGIAFLSAGGTTWGVQVFASYPGHVGPAAPAPPAAEPAPAPAPAAEPARRGSATEGAAEPDPEAEPTPAATSLATPRPPVTHRSQARPPAEAEDAAPADRGDGAFATWLWVGIPSVTALAALAGGVVVLRSRGLIGRSTGRHSA